MAKQLWQVILDVLTAHNTLDKNSTNLIRVAQEIEAVILAPSEAEPSEERILNPRFSVLDSTKPNQLDPFPFTGTDANLFECGLIIDPSIQLTTTPVSMRQEAIRKAEAVLAVAQETVKMWKPQVESAPVPERCQPKVEEARQPVTLVERLREKRGILDNRWPGPSALETEAADRIEELEAHLRDFLGHWEKIPMWNAKEVNASVERARAALPPLPGEAMNSQHSDGEAGR